MYNTSQYHRSYQYPRWPPNSHRTLPEHCPNLLKAPLLTYSPLDTRLPVPHSRGWEVDVTYQHGFDYWLAGLVLAIGATATAGLVVGLLRGLAMRRSRRDIGRAFDAWLRRTTGGSR